MDKISSLVPEFYYDLIGRAVPGAFLCSAVAWRFRTELASLGELNAAILTSLAFIAVYTAGFLLESVAALLLDPAHRLLRFLLECAPVCPENLLTLLKVDPRQVMRTSSSPASIAALLKLIAELAMLRGLCVVWILLWLSPIDLLSHLPLLVKAGGLATLVLVHYRWAILVLIAARQHAVDGATGAKSPATGTVT